MDAKKVTSRFGRQIKTTEKMAQFNQQKDRDRLAKLELENEILRTRLEISMLEQSIRDMSGPAKQTPTTTRNQASLVVQGAESLMTLDPPNVPSSAAAMVQPTSISIPRESTKTLTDGYTPIELPGSRPLHSTPKADPKTHQPDPEILSAKNQHDELQSNMNKSMKALDISLSRLTLPKLEPNIFSGDFMDFPMWIKSFEALIENNTVSLSERLYYLDKYTAGDAKEAIKGYFAQGNDAAYMNAKRTLLQRYGDKYRAAETFKAQINDWQPIKLGDGESLRKLSDFLNHCESAMDSISHLRSLDSAEENRKIMKKLPRYVNDRWNRIVDKWLYGTEEDIFNPDFEGKYPPFSTFCKFLSHEARVACGPGSLSMHRENQDAPHRGNRKQNATSLNTDATVDDEIGNPPAEEKPKVCTLCKEDHALATCLKFKAMGYDDRMAHVKANSVCFSCLRKGHMKRECRRTGKPLLFFGLPPREDQQRPEIKDAGALKVEVGDTNPAQLHSPIVKVSIHHIDNPSVHVETYAMLDSQSNSCFITNELADSLGAPQTPVDLRLTTMSDKRVVQSQAISGLVVRGVREKVKINMPCTYTREAIPASENLIARPDTVKPWPHLKEIADELPEYDCNVKIGLLIGFNCSSALLPKAVKAAGDDEPYGVKTNLGWGITGSVGRGSGSDVHFSFRTHAAEVTPETVCSMFDREYNDTETTKPYSVEDSKFLKIVKEGIKQKTDGHFEIPLPLKENITIKNNKEMATKRLLGLKKRMQSSEKYAKDYLKFMNDMITKGYAEKIPEDELQSDNVWYIPHHGVYHPKKPEKIRVVFDASAEFNNTSLNQNLLQGPDLLNSLTGILCRFRKERIAFACDIEAMFYQVLIPAQHRDFLRFLWFRDGDTVIEEYRMKVHLFGAVSSPACANFALKTTADKFEAIIGTAAAEFVRTDFYVDDGLKSVPTVEEAQRLIADSIELCGRGGFKLHKFISHDRQVLENIPQELRSKELQSLNVSCDALPATTTLGIEWAIEEDGFKFRVEEKTKPVTRRSILSVVSGVFDPLGLISPFLLKGRKILQTVCRDGGGWDDPVPGSVHQDWVKWKEDLPSLSKIHIRRCYKPQEMDKEAVVELHHFCDASEAAYGACSYIRIVDAKGQVSTSLVMAKSRVSPAKPVTIPRLELMGATLAVKIAKFLEEELKYENVKHTFWTDSKIVLGYISNETRRFHVFVANRVQQIRDFTTPDQWRYVNTTENPADVASRGSSATNLADNTLWWYGPNFIRSAESLPTEILDYQLPPHDPEIKNSVSFRTHAEIPQTPVLERLQVFSCWHKAKRAVAVCLRLIRRLKERKAKIKGPRAEYSPVDIEEEQAAEVVILKLAQQEAFHSELQAVKAQKNNCPKKNKLHRLDPILSSDGIMRVGGRIKRASLNYNSAHPAIIPKGHVAYLLIAHYHGRYGHSGTNNTLGQIRAAGYWIVRGRSQVSSYVYRCVTCRTLRGQVVKQKMADLPADRLDPCPPFTYSAVDLFGPFLIKEGRSEKKRWGSIFVCMVSRAVHIEVVASLTTDSFINAYRRFVSRRGPIRQLRCDRGTNFIGAKNELENERVRQKLQADGCDYFDFCMNFPHASHMGGAWERMIRSVRNALSALLIAHPGRMDDESLHTLLTEAEAIVNSRPLTYYHTDDCKEEPLTAMQLLTLKSKVVMPPPGTFVKEDVYCRKRWRKVQYMANQFWQRWIKEFLPTLQERRKWPDNQQNIAVGDIVLVMDESLGRCQWPKGLVTAVYPSDDGLVRKVSVRMNNSEFDRPVQKLIVLLRRSEY